MREEFNVLTDLDLNVLVLDNYFFDTYEFYDNNINFVGVFIIYHN